MAHQLHYLAAYRSLDLEFKCEGIKTMAIEKKSLISNSKTVSANSTSKASPSAIKLQTARLNTTLKMAKATAAVTALRVGKANALFTARIVN